MRYPRSKQERNGQQNRGFTTHKDAAQALAPEIRAARMLLSPSAQEDIAHLAEGIEVTLSGNMPTRAAHSQRKRRGLVLWVTVLLGGTIVLALAGSSGWASALKYHSIAEKNAVIADQEKQLAFYYENQAEIERKLREDLQARDEQLKYITTSQLEIIADLSKKGHYAKAISQIDILTEVAEALDERNGGLIERISQLRDETILAVITDIHGSEVDLSGVRTELEKLSTINNQQPK